MPRKSSSRIDLKRANNLTASAVAHDFAAQTAQLSHCRPLFLWKAMGQAADDSNKRRFASQAKRGRPRQEARAPLGSLILKAMKLLGLSYKDVVSESERLARVNQNPALRVGKSTLGNIISGSIRQPGMAKLDALRIILNLSRAEMESALGLQPERFLEQLEVSRARTHEMSLEAVTRNRRIRIPLMREDATFQHSQFLEGALKRWENVEVEYLSLFYPPHFCYVVVGEDDRNASPIIPPGSRLLVNKLLNEIRPSQNLSFHERELFCVMTPQGLTCVYLEKTSAGRILLVPHPESKGVREEYRVGEIEIIGQVVGVLYRRQ